MARKMTPLQQLGQALDALRQAPEAFESVLRERSRKSSATLQRAWDRLKSLRTRGICAAGDYLKGSLATFLASSSPKLSSFFAPTALLDKGAFFNATPEPFVVDLVTSSCGRKHGHLQRV